MESSYERADTRVRAIGGTSAEHLSSFITWLGSQQFSVGYACIVARHALAFGRWGEARGIEVAALTDGEIARYQRSRARRRSRRPETRRQERQALNLLLLFLREQGLCAAAAPCATAVDRVCADFAHHLRCNHALTTATVDTYTRVARQFLAWRFGQAEVCLSYLRPSDSIAFVRHESKRMAPPAVKVAANALRSFLRFGEFRGEVPAGLSTGVPSVATWTTTPPISGMPTPAKLSRLPAWVREICATSHAAEPDPGLVNNHSGVVNGDSGRYPKSFTIDRNPCSR